jgi:Arc/MetJ-type ribon-helix-helix transcriptional regulator
MKSRISGRIQTKDKEKIKLLVEKKAFPSMSEFYRVAISRLLRDISHGKKKGLQKIRDTPDKKGGREMKELIKLIDDVY